MRLFTTINEYYSAITEAAKEIQPKEAYISTFSLYAGVTDKGLDTRKIYGYPNKTADFLDKLARNNVKTNIVVGLPETSICFDGCENCITKWNKTISRYEKTRDNWPDFNWVFINGNHTKFIVLVNSDQYRVFSGGRNLSESSWDDLTFRLPDDLGLTLVDRFYTLASAPKVDLETLYVKCGA